MWLTIRSGADKGKTIKIPEAGVGIGRSPDSGLPLPDERVSRHHAQVTVREDGRLILADLGSTNGTFVNGERISAPVTIQGDERLRFGDTEIEVSADDPALAQPRPVLKDPWTGTIIGGKYKIVDRVAKGGMGVVYRAERIEVGDTVALKMLSPDLARSPRFRQKFEEEWHAAAALKHPNILPVFDVGKEAGDEGVMYIVMPLVDGGDLGGLIEREGPLAAGRALALLSQVASALDVAHSRSILHRDVKPSNILLELEQDGFERAYLCDFGIAKLAAATGFTMPGQVPGTPAYMAPEQITGERIDGRADQYALGCVMYECLTKSVPFETQADSDEALRAAHVHSPPPRLSADRPELPAALDSVLARAMANSRDERFATCAAFISAAKAASFGPAGGQPETIPDNRMPEQPTIPGPVPPMPAPLPTVPGPVPPMPTPLPTIPGPEAPTSGQKKPERGRSLKVPVLAGGAIVTVAVVLLVVFLGKGSSLANARLEGTFSFHLVVSDSSETSLTQGATQDDTIVFTPDCQSGPCDVEYEVLDSSGSSLFSGTLSRDGSKYTDNGTFDDYCGGADVTADYSFRIEAKGQGSIDGASRVNEIEGSYFEDRGSDPDCGSLTLTGSGSLQS